MPAPNTLNDPVTTPPDIEQVRAVKRSAGLPPEREQVVSALLKPLPEMVIVSPPLPWSGEKAIVGTPTLNPAVTVVCGTWAGFDIVTVYEPKGAVLRTVKLPVRTPFMSILH